MEELRRYLQDGDYNGRILDRDLQQLIQYDDETLTRSESDAEMEIISRLSDEYEIEKEFELGKSIKQFDSQLEEFKGTYFYHKDKVMLINGYKNPSVPPRAEDFWEQLSISVSEYDSETNYSVGEYVEGYDSNGELLLWQLTWEGYEPSGQEFPNEDYFYVVGSLYNQDEDYNEEDIVKYKNNWFKCLLENGQFNENIIQPTLSVWEEVIEDGSKPILQFTTNSIYSSGDRVSYGGKHYDALVNIKPETGVSFYPDRDRLWEIVSNDSIFQVTKDYSVEPIIYTTVLHNGTYYALKDTTNVTVGVTPNQDLDSWEVIEALDYVRGTLYNRGTNGFVGYVKYNDEYFYIQEKNEDFANPTTVENGKAHFSPTKDPRNRNIVNKMIHITLHCLHSSVVPDNIPTVRISNYENSIKWLDDASKMKINPSIPRKVFTYKTKNPIDGTETETSKSASRWVVNNSVATRDSWSW